MRVMCRGVGDGHSRRGKQHSCTLPEGRPPRPPRGETLPGPSPDLPIPGEALRRPRRRPVCSIDHGGGRRIGAPRSRLTFCGLDTSCLQTDAVRAVCRRRVQNKGLGRQPATRCSRALRRVAEYCCYANNTCPVARVGIVKSSRLERFAGDHLAASFRALC